MRSEICSLVLLIFSAIVLGLPAAKAETYEAPLIWYADVQNPAGIHAQQGNLYAALFNSNRMPARLRPVTNSPYVSEILTNDGLVFGGFNVVVDAVLCDMNPHVCSRTRIPVDTALGNPGVSGFEASPGNWRLVPGISVIVVPDVIFTREREIRKYQKKSGDTIKSIVLKDRKGCANFDRECLDLLDTINRSIDNYADTGYEGAINVPTLSLSAVIDVSCSLRPCVGVNRPSAQVFKSIPQVQGDVPTGLVRPEGEILDDLLQGSPSPHGKFRSTITTKEFADRAIKNERLFSYQKDMFEAMAFPYTDSVPPSTLTGGFTGAPVIGVIDNQIDNEHCDFDKSRMEQLWVGDGPSQKQKIFQAQKLSASAGGALNLALTCDEYADGAAGDADHGTHIVGIIAASNNGKGVTGINPYANVAVLQIESSEFASPRYSQAFGRAIIKLLAKKAFIVNVSRHIGAADSADAPVDSVPTRLFDWIKQTEEQVLWISAVGNDQVDLNSTCAVHPACYNTRNVLSVVSLGKNQFGLHLSATTNFDSSGQRHYLGALGENIVSAALNNRFSPLSGSSQAAPQVSAIAGYIASMAPKALPAQIANRLLGCSTTHWDKLRQAHFGSLNAECALQNAAFDLVYLKNGSAPIKGHLLNVRIGGEKSARLPFENSAGTALPESWAQHLLAFQRFGADMFTVFFADRLASELAIAKPSQDVSVEKNVKEADVELEFKMENGEKQKYRMDEIQKYVRAI